MLCCLQRHSPFQVQPVTSAGPRNAVQQQRKRWKVRGNECNAPPAGSNRATNIVSGYTLRPRLCITHCRPGPIRSHHSRFVTVHNPQSSLAALERALSAVSALDGAPAAIGTLVSTDYGDITSHHRPIRHFFPDRRCHSRVLYYTV